MSYMLIFDIDKTNKKCLLFDENYQEVWKEYAHPEILEKIRWSLHFPQFLSFLISGKPVSYFTNILKNFSFRPHTMLSR